MSILGKPMQNVAFPGPRYTNILYNNDGLGRDSYIYGNNGGFTVFTNPSSQLKPSSIRLGGGGNYSRKEQPVHGKAPRYIQNGGGRDSYISHNEGGFSSPNYLTRHLGRGDQFQNSLRSYQRSDKKGFSRRSPSQTSLHSIFNNQQSQEEEDLSSALPLGHMNERDDSYSRISKN